MKRTKSDKLQAVTKQIEIAETVEYSASGNAIIELSINDSEDFYSPYSANNYKMMRPEVENYITNYISNTKANDKYEFLIHCKGSVESEAKERITKTIKRTFAESVADINTSLKHNAILSMLFLIIGMAFLVAYIFVAKYNFNIILECILDILAWVFVWEATDTFLMKRYSQRREKNKYIKLMMAEVNFAED